MGVKNTLATIKFDYILKNLFLKTFITSHYSLISLQAFQLHGHLLFTVTPCIFLAYFGDMFFSRFSS
jgi:hypothetical protein